MFFLLLTTMASAADWTGPLVVQSCEAPARQLPRDTEVVLGSTLIVLRDDVSGSAVVVSPDGFALTAAHVIGSAEQVEVVLFDERRVTATVVRVDERQDVAVLKLDGNTYACARPWVDRRPIGSDVFVLGSPAGEVLSFSVSKGIVSGYREFEGERYLQIDASVNPGNSGGPVVDDQGRVVGIASWKVAGHGLEGLSFAVPTQAVVDALELSPGERSTTDIAAAQGRRELPGPDPVGVSSGSERRKGTLDNPLVVGGGALVGLGSVVVLGTGLVYLEAPPMNARQWTGLVALNTLGWVAVGSGGALVVGGAFLDGGPGLAIGGAW